jgi:hypothetical protein
MIKHWRQVWTYEATELWHYEGKNIWSKKVYEAEDVQGKWAQKVYNVDDALRYECVAEWVNTKTDNSWTCTTGAPLPRREKERKDYHLLDRTNVHRITTDGWVHEQYNTKVRIEHGARTQISREKGYNTYVRIDDENCQKAIRWWPKKRASWSVIQRAWLDFYNDETQISLKDKHWGVPLWVRLFLLANQRVNTPKREEKVYKKALKNMNAYRIKKP